MTSFLDLPPEVRNHVYSYAAIPRSTYFVAHHGLYFSCHQISAEMDKECGAILQRHVDLIGRPLPEGTIELDPSVFAKQHVHMSLDFMFPEGRCTAPPAAFTDVIQLYYIGMTFKLLSSQHAPDTAMAVIRFLEILISLGVFNAKCITFEIPATNATEIKARGFYDTAEAEGRLIIGGYKLKWHRDMSGKARLTWDKVYQFDMYVGDDDVVSD